MGTLVRKGGRPFRAMILPSKALYLNSGERVKWLRMYVSGTFSYRAFHTFHTIIVWAIELWLLTWNLRRDARL